ncbi:MAG: serine hydrolase [Acidobacteriaceae bacterium]|nr:serine hydrolase [Acidobacteriaceae bacterium]
MGAGLDSELQQRVAAIASAHQGHMTLFAEDLATGKTVAIEPDTPVPTASVIKLAILFEALEQVRSGKAHFEDRLTLTKADQVPGAGVLLFFDPPQQLTLKDALTLMVVMSDNAATNLVIDHLGLPDINRRIEWMGLHNTHLFNKVFSKSSPALPPKLEAEHKKFGLGETTAREMASVIERIYRCELGTAREATPDDLQLCTIATTMLGNQFYRDCIPRFLDGWNAPETGSGTAVGNKTGSLDEVRNDVAIVAAKRGPIVISAFTFDNKDQSWRADNQAQIAIANAAKAIVESWSPEGLAPNEYKPHPADSNRP